jgi:hypothetical protein
MKNDKKIFLGRTVSLLEFFNFQIVMGGSSLGQNHLGEVWKGEDSLSFEALCEEATMYLAGCQWLYSVISSFSPTNCNCTLQ